MTHGEIYESHKKKEEMNELEAPTCASPCGASEAWRTTGLANDDVGNGNVQQKTEHIIDELTSVLEERLNALLSWRKVKRRRAGQDYGGDTATITGTTAASELRLYVSRIAYMYRNVRYHGLEHATHVTLSINQMINMLNREEGPQQGMTQHHQQLHEQVEEEWDNPKLPYGRASSFPCNAPRGGFSNADCGCTSRRRGSFVFSTDTTAHDSSTLTTCENYCSSPSTYGIGTDPYIHFALVFAALIHDVDHRGVPNAQLVKECHELAVLFHDRSVAEQHSLRIAFRTLMEKEFCELRHVICPTVDDILRFRKIVIDLLLCTDIASAERTQIGLAKWKEAFEAEEQEEQAEGTAHHYSHDEIRTDPQENGKEQMTTPRHPPNNAVMPDHKRRRHSVTCFSPVHVVQLHPSQPSPRQHHAHQPYQRAQSATGGADVSRRHSLSLGMKRTSTHLTNNDGTVPWRTEVVVHHRRHHCKKEELCASITLEQMMQGADVAHTMQSFHTFLTWNIRLYEELYEAFLNQRGFDVTKGNWYKGQIDFYDNYVLPLAGRLRDCGVFGTENGSAFRQLAQENRQKWIVHGRDISNLMADLVLKSSSEMERLERKRALLNMYGNSKMYHSDMGDTLQCREECVSTQHSLDSAAATVTKNNSGQRTGRTETTMTRESSPPVDAAA